MPVRLSVWTILSCVASSRHLRPRSLRRLATAIPVSPQNCLGLVPRAVSLHCMRPRSLRRLTTVVSTLLLLEKLVSVPAALGRITFPRVRGRVCCLRPKLYVAGLRHQSHHSLWRQRVQRRLSLPMPSCDAVRCQMLELINLLELLSAGLRRPSLHSP